MEGIPQNSLFILQINPMHVAKRYFATCMGNPPKIWETVERHSTDHYKSTLRHLGKSYDVIWMRFDPPRPSRHVTLSLEELPGSSSRELFLSAPVPVAAAEALDGTRKHHTFQPAPRLGQRPIRRAPWKSSLEELPGSGSRLLAAASWQPPPGSRLLAAASR